MGTVQFKKRKKSHVKLYLSRSSNLAPTLPVILGEHIVPLWCTLFQHSKQEGVRPLGPPQESRYLGSSFENVEQESRNYGKASCFFPTEHNSLIFYCQRLLLLLLECRRPSEDQSLANASQRTLSLEVLLSATFYGDIKFHGIYGNTCHEADGLLACFSKPIPIHTILKLFQVHEL